MSTVDGVMTLQQLHDRAAELLKTMPPETPVYSDGCDCTGEAADLIPDKEMDKTVVLLIRR